MTTEPMFNPPVPRTDPAARARLQTTLTALLNEGGRFTSAVADPLTAEELRGWVSRINQTTRLLADHLEAPARAAVMAMLDHDGIADDAPALVTLRLNIAGASFNQFGEEVGVNGNTIRRLEDQGLGCVPSTARKIADRYGLRVHELFVHQGNADKLTGATVGHVRQALFGG